MPSFGARGTSTPAQLIERGVAALRSGHLEAAARHFDAVCSIAPDDGTAQAYRAWTRYAAHRGGQPWLTTQLRANTEQILGRAIRAMPSFAAGYRFLALIANDRGEVDRAIKLAKRALAINPADDEANALLLELEPPEQAPAPAEPAQPQSVLEKISSWLGKS